MSFEDMMKKLKLEYVSNLPSKLEELKFLVEKKDFAELENFFHKLKGSGKSYGVSEVTTYGEHFENLLKKDKSLSDEQLNGSVELLDSIISARTSEKEYDIQGCQTFQKLKSAA